MRGILRSVVTVGLLGLLGQARRFRARPRGRGCRFEVGTVEDRMDIRREKIPEVGGLVLSNSW